MNAHQADLADFSDDDLRQLAHGCTELSCMYHGQYNRELRLRENECRRPAQSANAPEDSTMDDATATTLPDTSRLRRSKNS